MSNDADSKKTAEDLIKWIRHYAATSLDSYHIDKNQSFPPHVLLDFGNQGFFGMHISREYGGLDLNTTDILTVIEQIAAIDLTLTTLVIESIQGAHTLEKYASNSMKAKYLHMLATGRIFTAGAMTETEAGSNPRVMQSVAIPDDEGGWLLKGTKRWVGMGGSAALIAIYVQQLDHHNNWQGMSGFLVPQGTPGLHIGAESPTMGLRGFAKNTIHMDNIKVSHEHLLGKSGDGMEIAQDNIMYIRLCLAAASLGAMKRSVQLMSRYAENRLIATGPLLENPITLIRLSEMTAIIEALDHFIYFVSSLYDKDPALIPEEVYMIAKTISSEYLGWMTDLLVQTLGARGYEEASGVSQLFRDARVFRIFEGPTEALNMYVGSKLLEKNSDIEHFFCHTLNQKTLFNEIKFAIDTVKEHCQSHKKALFAEPFSVNYWTQALVGEIISYGLILATIESGLSKKPSQHLKRSSLWLRNKFDEAVQKGLSFSMPEKMLLSSTELKQISFNYTKTIGDVEQHRKTQEVLFDRLLKCHPKPKEASLPTATEDSINAYATMLAQKPLVATESCRQKLLYDWNNVGKGKPFPDIFVHQLFEEQARKNPEEIAVVFQDRQLTYAELNHQANRVAYRLKKEGVRENTLIALYIERSIEMIIGLLGILKAGGAYLPLDYNYPTESLTFMFEDSGAELILAQRKSSHSMPFDSKNIMMIDDILAESTPILDVNEINHTSTDNLAYVIYTSGSTGHPKGVMLQHKSLTNLILWHKENIQEKRTVLQFTTLNFDMSFLEIFSALSTGGTLVLIRESDRLELSTFSHIIKTHQVQQLITSVHFLKNMAEYNLDLDGFHSLQEIIVAGEQIIITPAILSLFNHLKTCKLLNYYGPCETHVVTAYEFPENTADWPELPPIGRVIANTKILVLNEEKELVPIGTPGEIYIGGVSLASGYVNRTDLTQEKFISDPWSEKPHARLYRTGDIGKYLPDGNLVFLGRKDAQIKIRGFMVEPQEVESQLMKHPSIKEAIVIAKTSLSKDKYLEAFISIQDQESDDLIHSIYTFLQKNLPTHMIPAAVHIIDKMPLTGSGKINRLALEKFTPSITHPMNSIIEPRTHTEKIVVDIIRDFFNIHIGTNSSFTSIGGNSLLAMQIVSKLRDTFSIELPAHSILSDPSIRAIAKRIDSLISSS